MKRNEKIMRLLFEAEGNKSLTRAAESVAPSNCLGKMSLSTSDKTQQPQITDENISIDVSVSDDIQVTTEGCCPGLIDNDVTLPTFAPILDSTTPVATLCSEECGPKSIDNDVTLPTFAPILEPTTPVAPLFSPITPINRNTFLTGDENSSPVPYMSPSTLQLLDILQESVGSNRNYDSDDSLKDPDYIADKDIDNSSSDELHQVVSISISNPNSPKKKKISDPTKWKRRIERDKRLKGEAYKTIKGKCVSATPMKQPGCLAKEKHKCNDNVPEEVRKTIYTSFRSLGTLEAQRQFIIQHVTKQNKKRSTTDGPSRKKSTHHYSFTIGHEKVSVCREFFLDTLNIKEGIIRGALKKVSSEGAILADKRGKKPPSNKLSADRLNLIKKHIFSFPTMESHYCRKNTEYKYLESGLNLKIMYSLYKKVCEKDRIKPAGIETYRKVFRSYKLKFHVPKKDLCKKCVAYKELKSHELTTNSQDDSHSKHLKRRDDAYLRRDADKTAAKNDTKTLAFNFDLEAVLSTPKGASGPFFYVRKLAVYNLTFYKFGDQDVDCFTWDETEGKRGSIEMATCVFKYISSKQGITHVRIMSDNCGGQQKNFNFSCMLLYLVTNNPTIQTIDHVFYEAGHSHMECDSIHSKIEQKSKKTAVYTPEGWIQIMRLARTNPRPFNVNVLTHEEFLDFNRNQCQFAEEITKQRKKPIKKKKFNKGKKNDEQERNEQQDTEEIKKTNFQDAVWIQYRKDSPMAIFIKVDYNDESFKELKIKPKKMKNASIVPVPAYCGRIPISAKKKEDLMKLCLDNQIPRYYHSFYENLPASGTVEDRLPEPDVEEED